MAITVEEIIRAFEEWAPKKLAEEWDNIGLQLGSLKAKVKKIGFALDVTPETISQAASQKLDCLVTHHPFFFKAFKNICWDSWPGIAIKTLCEQNISVISFHTNLDAAKDGVSDILAKLLNLEVQSSLLPANKEDSTPPTPFEGQEQKVGLGRVGVLPMEHTLEDLARKVAQSLDTKAVFLVGDPEKQVKKVALCAGAGGELLKRAYDLGAQVYITAEVKYHQAREAEALGLGLISCGHFESEILIVPKMAEYLKSWAEARGSDLEIFVLKEKTPFLPVF